ncbi:MAG: hypothetical protein K6L73_02015 [Cellvibrionaceae bacterium]
MNLGKTNSVGNLFESMLPLEKLQTLTPEDYILQNVGNASILKVYPPLDESERVSQSKDIAYYIAIDESCFVSLSFTYFKSYGGDYMPSGWQDQIESDIQEIINSITIEYAPSVQARIDAMTASPHVAP